MLHEPNIDTMDMSAAEAVLIIKQNWDLRGGFMGVEIEKKFLVKELPAGLSEYPFHVIEQGYLNVYPAIRVRREDDVYYMTYKGDTNGPGIGKTEYNMPLDRESYEHMVTKADGNMIRKKRYMIPLNGDAFSGEYKDTHPGLVKMMEEGEIRIELDVFDEPFKGFVMAEVEFPDEEAAAAYVPAGWFGEEVTGDRRYSNAHMSMKNAKLSGTATDHEV